LFVHRAEVDAEAFVETILVEENLDVGGLYAVGEDDALEVVKDVVLDDVTESDNAETVHAEAVPHSECHGGHEGADGLAAERGKVVLVGFGWRIAEEAMIEIREGVEHGWAGVGEEVG